MTKYANKLCFNGQIRTLTAKENCQTTLSKNVTIDHLGKITILLGDYFSFLDNSIKVFNDVENHTVEMLSYSASKIIGIKRGKEIEERSVKELVGSVLKEFMNSDRYE